MSTIWTEWKGYLLVHRGLATAAGQDGRDNYWYDEGRPPLRARAAGIFTGTLRAGTPLQVMAARPWAYSYIGENA